MTHRRNWSGDTGRYSRSFGLSASIVGKPNVHHDALEFPDGETVLLTRLCEGQHATVLQLPVSPRPVNAAERQKGDSLVR